jgi:hypothetical protein
MQIRLRLSRLNSSIAWLCSLPLDLIRLSTSRKYRMRQFIALAFWSGK